MLSVLEIIKKTTDFFATKGIESARLDAELLIGHSLGLRRMQLYLQFERLLTEAELEKMRALVRRRAAREPLQYITGEVEWGGIRLKVDGRALIPRPETELLFEIALEAAGAARPETAATAENILDLGTGTGALALALAKARPDARVLAADASDDALALARENAAALSLDARVSFLKSDWFGAVPAGEKFDLIVSNPPYLTREEIAETEPEVRQFEPHSALVAEDDGCADLLKIISGAPAFLKPGGVLALETGIAQHAALLAACADAGFARSESRQDLTKRDRFVIAWLG
ncbi:release factor glutamine methyltransferase [Ereboglobus sp. PH5-10]|uniref:peptide chain release factor N(5)-glutamine methyltransferase n=1 Tax=Ereboglobus sp. PH5-10 TaxID=2940629 RepID=UPI002404AB05|nr:peptide chain release factor N(5)-glutamine methyltransferase [Ereboglobus sp. PH5-10]MDF9827320.1 release factor glutamine methyltransferase [Ereboglobus sp. PH5-10]